ncbi:hypothetical protein CFC21_093797 [Triticum aestivum]|uniref:Uncharacterized protein n=2 Tax=Triticum aestivum TaxID=4565 RepID=A0A3B6QLH8_WHEAT|nr:uncharacterized protein LOC123145593 [Triticum aestivum]KAF7091154.1 hypothetical protein CFC21_093797 [Triticum aestivum]
METTQQQRRHQLRTPMDPLVSLAASFLSAFSPSSSEQGTTTSTILLLPLPVAAARALSVLRRLALLATQAFISLFFAFLSALSPPPPPPPPSLAPSLPPPLRGDRAGAGATAAVASTCVERALGHVLWVASRLPVASRKHELVRGLAERLLDENNVGARVAAVTRAALAGAFERTLRQLEASAGGEWGPPGMELAVRAVRSGVRWWRPTVAALEGNDAFGGPAAEKLAAELLWLGQKMAECGAAREAAVQFGAASRLGSRALVAEPTLQVALLRLAVFLFRHANSAEFEQEEGKAAVAEQRMEMLRSWLPLLCRGSNGTDAPVLSGRERAEMVTVLEELIEKLRWEQQEEALALWLHHFAACPDTDWPNLERCYTRWYAESRKLLA